MDPASGLSPREQGSVINRRFGPLTTRLFVLLLFGGLAILMTWPLAVNLRKAVPGPPWDNLVWLYDLWWLRHSIVDLGQWPVFNPTIFYPFGYDLRLSETMLANKLLAAPFLFWGDEVIAYNAFLLISFVLTAYATYLLIAYLTDNPYAATVGGAIFAFAPYRMHAMAAGWLPLLGTQWIPLLFLYLERALRERKVRHGLVAGLFFALTVLSSWYYVYIVGSMLLVYLLFRLRPWRETLRDGRVVVSLVLLGVVALLLMAPVAWPVVSRRSGQMGWSLTEIEKWTASIEDFFLPNVYHPVWGESLLRWRSGTLRYPWYAPGFVYLGAIALLLALRGSLRGRSEEDRAAGPLLWVGLVSFVLSLGVALHWNSQAVGLRLPEKAETFVIRVLSTVMSKWALNKASLYEISFPEGTVPIPLPAMLLYLFVPLGDALRTLYRFGVMTTFVVSTLAGVGLAKLSGWHRPPELDLCEGAQAVRPSRRRAAVALTLSILCLGLVLLDFCCAPLAFGFSEIGPQPLDRWLAARPDDAVIMQFPLIRALSGDSLYRTRYHGRRVAYGHGTFYPEPFLDAMDALATFPSEESLQLLSGWGVTHMVVGSRVYDAGWGDVKGQTAEAVQRQIEVTPRLTYLGVSDDAPIWRDERVSHILVNSPPVEPILVDRTYLYELQ